ncbi:hypothetical protein Tco_0736723, partial [Tanacetum coccineum]
MCGSSIGAYCVDNLGVSLYPASQKEKVAHPYFDSSYGSFVADVGSQPYGMCGSFINDGSDNSTGAYSLGYGCSVRTGPVRGIVLDFENSKVRLSLDVLDDGVWFRSSAVNGSFHDDHYDCESSSSTFKGKEGRTKARSSLQKKMEEQQKLDPHSIEIWKPEMLDGYPYCSVEQNNKCFDSLHQRVRSRVTNRHLPVHGTATQNARSSSISNEEHHLPTHDMAIRNARTNNVLNEGCLDLVLAYLSWSNGSKVLANETGSTKKWGFARIAPGFGLNLAQRTPAANDNA